MRKLTKQELELAPDWATHYWIHDNKVMFESQTYFQLLSDGVLGCRYNNAAGYVSSHAAELSKKPFDITKHDFSDDYVLRAELEDGCSLSVELQSHELGFISFNKNDAIAISKALGVTAEDFK